MGIVIGPISIADWLTMKAIKYDIDECSRINKDGKYDLSIRCNKNALKLYFNELYNAA